MDYWMKVNAVSVIPALAGIQTFLVVAPRINLDARLRQHDAFLLRLRAMKLRHSRPGY
ncbi:MAG: hypothetical protein ACXW6V_19480 [Candidatus Binatia bacterium]